MYGEFSQEENIANPRPNADVDYRHLGGKQQNNANSIDEYALYVVFHIADRKRRGDWRYASLIYLSI